MRKIITHSQALRYLIIVLAVIGILAVFPCRIFKEDIISHGNESPAGEIAVGGEAVALQQFVPEYDHIESIGFMIQGDYPDTKLAFRVFREKTGELLREITLTSADFELVDTMTYTGAASATDRHYADVYVNLDTEVGENYFYTIEGLSGDISVLFEVTGNSGAVNNGYMQYAGENKDACNIVSRYVYRQPLRKMRSLVIIVAIMAVAAVLLLLLDRVAPRISFAAAWLDKLTTPGHVLRLIANPVIIIGSILAVVAIGPLHMFGIYVADIVVMILGVLLLAAVLLYMVNAGLGEHETDRPGRPDSLRGVRRILQSVCIACALWSCVHYMNALYEVFHDIAWRKMAFFLGLGLIVTFSMRELVNWYNILLLIAGVITSRIYYVHNLPDMVDEYHVNAMFWTCMCIPVIYIFITFIIRCIVVSIRDRVLIRAEMESRVHRIGAMQILRAVYTVLTLILCVMMVVRRNLRYWPVMMFIIGGCYVFRLFFWEDRASFCDNLTRGILLHFAACVIYCLLHRPYEAYEYVRFPLVFHTVTITAEYMALVMSAAVVRLFGAYRNRRRIRDCVWEMFTFGCVATYTLFTMSRTAMTGIVACGVVMWFLYAFTGRNRTKEPGAAADQAGTGRSGGGLHSLAVSFCMAVVSLLVCFPICFTAQKAIPGLTGSPKLLEIERYPQTLMLSRDLESDDYITFSRFAKAFAHKMLGLDEDVIKLDLYTIYGRRTDVYVDEMQLKDAYIPAQTAPADIVLLAAGDDVATLTQRIDAAAYKQDGSDSGFTPPHEYSLEGEPPEEWWDPDYWTYDDTEGWLFMTWKLEEESDSDVTNGRMDIFRAYLDQMNDEGHEEMGALLNDGSIAAHAHNIYLQVAYDHGKIIGIVFGIWVMVTCITALCIFLSASRRSEVPRSALGIMPAVSVTYAVCGITEWISHPCNPLGMVMMLVCCVLLTYRDETV